MHIYAAHICATARSYRRHRRDDLLWCHTFATGKLYEANDIAFYAYVQYTYTYTQQAAPTDIKFTNVCYRRTTTCRHFPFSLQCARNSTWIHRRHHHVQCASHVSLVSSNVCLGIRNSTMSCSETIHWFVKSSVRHFIADDSLHPHGNAHSQFRSFFHLLL